MTEETPRKKRILSRWDWLWLSIVFIILLTIGLQKCGIHVIQKTEDSEMIDRPHQ